MNLADLTPNPDNPRNIKPEKLDKLAQSIKDFPKMMVKRPIVYDENKIIIGGNMRYKAIEKLGMTEIPDEWTSDASDFTPDERKRFIMQDNAEMGVTDWDMVANQYELEDLDAWGIDVPYADVEEEVEEDEAPEVSSEPPVSQLGVVYQLGRHRVMCGDSTDKTNVELLMDGVKADMVFTDPPYGAGFDIENDNENAIDVFSKFYSVMPCDDNIYICCDFRCIGDFYNEVRKKHQVYNLIVWVKNLFGQGKLYHTKHEEIIFCGEGSFNNKNSNNDENVWNADSVRNFGGSKNAVEAVGHPTQKPIEICARAINNSSNKSNIVYDGFLGSGSTLIACEQTDRTCYGMELDEKYLDVIRKRWAKYVYPDRWEKEWEILTPAIEKL